MNEELWSKLSVFTIDQSGAQFTFSHRVARENQWSDEFTQRVIEEYKRFIYLCCEAGHPVTPSDEVDQIWHLHLCYTRSYWHDLCQDVLGKPVHHGPTKGGAEERDKFHDWYAKTKESYQVHFGTEPPADIWPSSKVRFANRIHRRVDCSQSWVVPHSVVWKSVAATGLLIGLAGCTHLVAKQNDAEIMIAVFFLFCIVMLALIIKFGKGGGGSGGCGAAGGSGGAGSCGSDSGCGSGCGGGCGGG